MDSKKILPIGVLASGAVIAIMGTMLVAAYVFEAIVARAGEPDQSLLFWYLPILYLGLIGMATGFGMGAFGVARLRKMRRRAQNCDTRNSSKGGG